jgi:hypothetical protein
MAKVSVTDRRVEEPARSDELLGDGGASPGSVVLTDPERRPDPELDGVMAAITDLDEDAFCSNPNTAALYGKYQRVALDDLDGSISTFSVALDRNPGSYYLADVLGQAQLEAGRIDDARATYRRAIEILDELATAGETNVWTHATYATASLVCGEFEMAEEHLDAVRGSGETTPSVIESIGLGVRAVAERVGLDSGRTSQLLGRLASVSSAGAALDGERSSPGSAAR